MIILLIFTILLSNALNNLKERSVFYSRTTLFSLFTFSIITYNCVALDKLENGLGLFNGLFNITSLTQSFNLFIFIIASIILIFNSFYYTNVYFSKNSSIILKNNNNKITNYKLILNVDNEKKINYFPTYSNSTYKSQNISYNINEKYNKQYFIGEYTLIILFIILGSVFLMSAGDLISLFISIELQSYGLYILCSLYRDSEKST